MVFLLLVYGAPYALGHSIWVHRLEWAGQPSGIEGMILTLLFYTVLFRYVARLWRVGWRHLRTGEIRPFAATPPGEP